VAMVIDEVGRAATKMARRRVPWGCQRPHWLGVRGNRP
jgi:hypothetical protein